MNKLLLFFCLFFCRSLFAQSGVDQFDFKVLQKIETWRTPEETKLLRTLSDINNYVNAAVPLGLLTAGIINHDKDMRQNALYVATSTASTAVFNLLLKKLIKRPRPFLIHASLTPVYKPGEYSFPSGHTSASFSTATALAMSYPKWYVIVPSFLWAGTVGYSRMYLGVHNPSDVAAGAVLGSATALGFSFIRP